ncbi:hypothetical protein ACFOLC_15975 [Lysobacter cavernae]|uniref:DUF2059 domain-containing protein n=1 Tax=Lysobacter cavernae TaxID=1685901 RepID=A0ABV7RUT0_9GAMM
MRSVLFLLLAMISSASLAGEASRLVQTARSDYVTKLGTELALKGHIPQANFDCVASIPLTTYTSSISAFLGSKLKSEEIAVALAFYESPAGTKYTQHGIVQFYKLKSIPTEMTSPSIGESEMQQILAFSRTSAGAKMINRDFSREMALAAKAAEDKELRACGYKGAL